MPAISARPLQDDLDFGVRVSGVSHQTLSQTDMQQRPPG